MSGSLDETPHGYGNPIRARCAYGRKVLGRDHKDLSGALLTLGDAQKVIEVYSPRWLIKRPVAVGWQSDLLFTSRIVALLALRTVEMLNGGMRFIRTQADKSGNSSKVVRR